MLAALWFEIARSKRRDKILSANLVDSIRNIRRATETLRVDKIVRVNSVFFPAAREGIAKPTRQISVFEAKHILRNSKIVCSAYTPRKKHSLWHRERGTPTAKHVGKDEQARKLT